MTSAATKTGRRLTVVYSLDVPLHKLCIRINVEHISVTVLLNCQSDHKKAARSPVGVRRRFRCAQSDSMHGDARCT